MKITPPLYATKAWQADGPSLVWQVSSRSSALAPKKFFLVLSADPTNPSCFLTATKPDQTSGTGSFINLLRKHCRSAVLTNAWKHAKTKDCYLILRRGDQEYFVCLHASRPPELCLVLEDQVLVRWSSKGTYTKKKPYTRTLPRGEVVAEFEPISLSLQLESNNRSRHSEPSVESPTPSKYQRESLARLKRRRKTLQKSLKKIEQKAFSAQELKDLKEKSHLLQSFAYRIKPESFAVTFEPELTGLEQPVTLELDPDKSVGTNVDLYFKRLKKAEKSFIKDQQHQAKLHKEISEINAAIAHFENTRTDDNDIAATLKRFNLATKKQSSSQETATQISKPYREFHTQDGIRILVGKGAKENDEMTKKAKSNDYWLHAVGVTGSHVIVDGSRFRNKALDPRTLNQAAILAIHFSKLRTDQSGEVYVTRKSNIKKKKGMPAGLWSIDRSETIYVKYTEIELKDVLNQLKS